MVERRRSFTSQERTAIIDGFRAWPGSQASYAASLGVSQGTISRWLRTAEAAGHDVPTMLEVLPTSAPTTPHDAAGPCATRVWVEDRLELAFDRLPPARWLAELASALRRC